MRVSGSYENNRLRQASPRSLDIRFDPATKTIVREGVPVVVNPFDRRALAEAIRLRELLGGEVVVVTMGPPQAREALVECLGQARTAPFISWATHLRSGYVGHCQHARARAQE